MVVRPQFERWKELRAQQAEMRHLTETDRRLVGERGKSEKRFEELSRNLPAFAPDKKMDVHWLSVMDDLAAKHNVQISKRQAGEEKKIGDVYELSIECLAWEASLDALIHFLFDLQASGAMLDVRQLLIKPKSPGLLGGRFSLSCAYTRSPAR
jgi:hypothetical protein